MTIAWLLPASLAASAADPQPGDEHAYLESPRSSSAPYRWGTSEPSRQAYVPFRCTVVSVDPLAVRFAQPMPIDSFREQWRTVDGEPFTETVTTRDTVVLGALSHRLGCTWSELEEWHIERRDRAAAGTDAMHLRLRAEKVRDELMLTPRRDRIDVDAAGFLALVDELDTLRPQVVRLEEQLAEAEEELEVFRQAGRALGTIRSVS